MSATTPIWVKICANTTLEDARVAADAGANAVGFVFAPSPRRVTVEQVAAIVPHLPSTLEKIGVFVDAGFEEISGAVRDCGLTGLQLHTGGGCEPAELRERFGLGLRILRVVHFGPDAAERAQEMASDPTIDGILVDSRTETAVGGTGLAFDWKAARTAIFGSAGAARFIAAGGLTPENVLDAMATLQPWGVDVASGVESAPGRKDPEKVRRFVANARTGGQR